MKKLVAGQLVAMVMAFSGSTAYGGNVGMDLTVRLGEPRAGVGDYTYREPVRPRVVAEYPAAENVRFVYPQALGFYVAVGVPYDLCYIDNSYYLFRDGRWLKARHRRGPWVEQRYRELPWSLRNQRIDRIRHYRDVRYEAPPRFPEHRRDHYPPYRERHDCDTRS